MAVFVGMSGSMAERAKKDIIKSFKDLGLRITTQTNPKIVNFLNVTFNLNSGKYYPYRKPNDMPLYIHRLSNHPPPILKHLLAAISKRLTDISHDTEVFKEAVPLYNDALTKSGFAENVNYVESRKERRLSQKRNCPRKITWFNPPYSKNVITRIG